MTIMPYTIVDTGTITGPDVYLGYEANAQMICLALNAAYRHGRASLMPVVDALYDDLQLCPVETNDGSSCGKCSRCKAVTMYLEIGKESK